MYTHTFMHTYMWLLPFLIASMTHCSSLCFQKKKNALWFLVKKATVQRAQYKANDGEKASPHTCTFDCLDSCPLCI